MLPDVPPDWVEAARRIAAPDIRCVLVLGPTDSGKSTLCRFLLRVASARDPALLDTDPAQKLVGPPACVTFGRRGADGEPALSALAFLSTLDPLRGWWRLVAGTERLAVEATAGLLLVNTSGLLRSAGRRLKAAKIAAVGPDLLLALGEDPGLEKVLADHPAIPALRLPRPPLVRRKGEGERRALRQGETWRSGSCWTRTRQAGCCCAPRRRKLPWPGCAGGALRLEEGYGEARAVTPRPAPPPSR